MSKLKVNKIRYFETRNGIGFQAGTKYGDIVSDGGIVFFLPTEKKGLKYQEYPEWKLAKAVEQFELKQEKTKDVLSNMLKEVLDRNKLK
jgi:hypothetical protein